MVGLDVYERDDGLYDWRFTAENGEQQCESNQGYSSHANALAGFIDSYRNMTEYVLSGLLQRAEAAAAIAGPGPATIAGEQVHG